MMLDHLGLFLRIGFIALFLIIWATMTSIHNHSKDGKSSPLVFNGLNGLMIAYVVLMLLDTIIEDRPYELVESLFAILVVAFVYLSLLILCQNWLRSHCSASTCAGLWALISVLYIFCADSVIGMGLTNVPLVMIPVPKNVVAFAGIIWAVGFAVYMVIAFYKHFKFRAQIEETAREVEEDDPRMILFQEIKKDYKSAEKTHLKVSDRVESPITVGISKLDLFLPNQEYTDEEMTWIYRHELTHIENRDNQTKVLMTFFRAAYWFIPQMNKACKQTAEDIELCCDEMVVLGCDEPTRMAYAKLIIDSPSDSRGFSTCLSGPGQSMKYRLTQVIHPRQPKYIIDFCVIAVALVFIFMTVGLVRISSTYGTVEDVLDINSKNIEIIQYDSGSPSVTEETVQKFLSDTTAYKVGYDLDVPMEGTNFALQNGKMHYNISYQGHLMEVQKYHEDYYDIEDTYYYIK